MRLVVSVLDLAIGQSNDYEVDTFQEMANTMVSMAKDITEGVVTVYDDDLLDGSLIIRLEVRDGNLVEE